MATYTTNYNLGKPEASDRFGNFRQLFNDNMDEIDANLGGGGGGGGHTIVDENGSDMPAESKLQFTGNVSVTDDNVNGATVVDVLGSGGNVYGAFIDPSRIIKASESVASGTTSTYTATEDCAVHIVFVGSTNPSRVYIDGVELETHYASQLAFVTHVLYVRKGQVFSLLSGDNSTNYTVYGLTQGTNGIYAPVIYSDNERVIGVWRDNKPLYQRTFDLGSDLSISYSAWVSSGVTLTNVENLITAYGTRSDNSFQGYVLAWNDNTDLKLTTPRNGNNSFIRYLTLQYTKTTDVAGSGNWNTDGVPTHHYSTNEQIVGTWIDSKPLYERVLELTQDTNLTADTWVKTEFNQTTMKALIKAVAVIGSSGAVIEALSGDFIDGKIALNSARNVGLNVADSARLIVQYTKSTD